MSGIFVLSWKSIGETRVNGEFKENCSVLFNAISLNKNIVMGALENHMMDIASLCAKYKVRALYAFGSVLNEKFNDQSDIDFLVDFHPLDVFEYGDNYFELKFSLEDLLHRHIDLLEEKAIKNPFFKKNIYEHRKLIYGS